MSHDGLETRQVGDSHRVKDLVMNITFKYNQSFLAHLLCLSYQVVSRKNIDNKNIEKYR